MEALFAWLSRLFGSNSRSLDDRIDELFHRANNQFNCGEHDNAIEMFSRCLELLPESYEAQRCNTYATRALVYYSTGQHEKGIDDTDRAIELALGNASDETLAMMYYQRGMMHLALGDQPQQQKDFEDAYRYDRNRELDPLRNGRHPG